MAELSRSISGSMIISINDHPDIRQVFSHLSCKEVAHKYSVGGGENQQDVVELIYGNWPDGVPAGRGSQEALFDTL